GGDAADVLSFSWLADDSAAYQDDELKTYARLMAAGAIENIDAIDAAIKKHLEHWSFERLKRVDLAILRMSVYALMYQRDIPVQISIDEAIEIAKEFGSEESYRFVNGVLDAVWKEIGG
ncbi:MAG TPA: transcription antitermination factor NusB, partial [Spirochaetales bacterium]|nr:transcription antitermination factor NusB [Spirochaetales bacterium]